MKKLKSVVIDVIAILFVVILAIFLVSFGKFNWKEIAIIFLVVYALNTICVIYLLSKNDELQSKFSWIFFLVIFPIITHIIFVLFRVRKDEGISREEYNNKLREFSLEENNNKIDDTNESIDNFFIKKYSNITKKNFYNSNIELFNHGFYAYDSLFNDLENAKKFIHIEMYIIKTSEIFEKLKKILIKKAEEGVEVKMILDHFGTWIVKDDEFAFLKFKGIQIEFFNKTFYPYIKPSDNNRLHRKFFVIDGQLVHSGGINISDEYSSYNKYYGYWIDLNFKIQGKIVNDYETIFLYDWYKVKKEKLNKRNYLIAKEISNSINYKNKVLLFDEGPNNYENLLESSLIDWIMNANTSIKICTPYFIPSKQLINALKYSIKKGVQIDLFIPGLPDKKIVYSATKYYSNELANLGANVFILNNMFLHTKLMVFDNKFAYIGTNNLDMRSLYTNYELMNIVVGEKPINEINQIIHSYKEHSIINKDNKKVSLIQNVLKKIFYELFAPLM